ncbi:hypothetical protein BDC45DRAFT_177273 [Circinella umbellata]|nr:hypothetical protein BDC45DRAFT_177273 [Circinella umbellata]
MASTRPANAEKDNFLALPTEFLPKPRHQPAGTVQSGRLIVVAYDQTRASDALLEKTIRTGLLQPDDDIRLESAYDIQPTSTAEQDERILIEEKEDMLLAVAKVLKDNSFQHVKVEVVQGDRKESLRDYCQSVKPTFIMTGSRGFGKIKSAVLGSVSDFLAKHCPCPVMIIKVSEKEIEARNTMAEKKKHVFSNFLGNK